MRLLSTWQGAFADSDKHHRVKQSFFGLLSQYISIAAKGRQRHPISPVWRTVADAGLRSRNGALVDNVGPLRDEENCLLVFFVQRCTAIEGGGGLSYRQRAAEAVNDNDNANTAPSHITNPLPSSPPRELWDIHTWRGP